MKTALQTMAHAAELVATLKNIDFLKAYILIEQAIPCVLHLENRVSEKIIKCIIQYGFSNMEKIGPTRQKKWVVELENWVSQTVFTTASLGIHCNNTV